MSHKLPTTIPISTFSFSGSSLLPSILHFQKVPPVKIPTVLLHPTPTSPVHPVVTTSVGLYLPSPHPTRTGVWITVHPDTVRSPTPLLTPSGVPKVTYHHLHWSFSRYCRSHPSFFHIGPPPKRHLAPETVSDRYRPGPYPTPPGAG